MRHVIFSSEQATSIKLAKRLASVNFIREVIDADTRQQLDLDSLIIGVEAQTRLIPFRHANGGIEHVYSQDSEKTKRALDEEAAADKAAAAAAAAAATAAVPAAKKKEAADADADANATAAAVAKQKETAAIAKEKEAAAIKAVGTTCVERDGQ